MYEVGDVLYIVSNKRKNVIPVKVVEQILRKSLEGENISYKVVIPGKEKNPIDLHAIDGAPYKSLDSARKVLYDQATEAINGLLSAASEISLKHFGPSKKKKYKDEEIMPYMKSQEAEVESTPTPEPLNFEPALLDFTAAASEGEVKVEMPDGTYASVKVPVVE